MVRARSIGFVAAVVALGAWGPWHDARACGLFGIRGVPRLEVEQTLIVFDPQAGREHFVREVRFAGADDSFAFVVPVPSVPEVASVSASPFEQLRTSWNFEEVDEPAVSAFTPESVWGGGWGGIGLGSLGLSGMGFGRGSGGVSVLARERVGSFTAAVLQATDAGALGRWLKDNRFSSTRSSETWLERYTRLGFTFVAFRYEKPAAGAPGEMKSETVRISFATPQPYYPYSEPDLDPSQEKASRLLRVWLISPSPYRPVAAHDEPGGRMFHRPWREGWRRDTASSALDHKFLSAVLPPGERLWVQTFVDQKTSRRGWGDAVLVPDAPVTYDEAARAKREVLLRLLLDGAPAARPEGATP